MSSLLATSPWSKWTTPGRPESHRLLLLGSGELGRKVAIETMRFGIDVIAVDSYANVSLDRNSLCSDDELMRSGVRDWGDY